MCKVINKLTTLYLPLYLKYGGIFKLRNERGAGRKAVISEKEIDIIKKRVADGEKVTLIAKEYGISRQALYKRLKSVSRKQVMFEYLVNGNVTTRIEVDFDNEKIGIENFGSRISCYAFGINQNPDWEDFVYFLENRILLNDENHESNCKRVILQDSASSKLDINPILKNMNNDFRLADGENIGDIPKFTFAKKDILFSRSDTDGYQLKALSRDRRYFVKSQASISGVFMNDWAVELIASDICGQLDIPHVKQRECEFVYGDNIYKAVYSDNFELDGYTFISFERLLERLGTSSKEQEFISLNAIDKMKWCADKLSVAGNIEYEKTLKYMLDLAIIDCLVGNIDRHTRNFGLFYNSFTAAYELPLIFDNGMGLFENDGYRDKYTSYDAAMMHVYVAPYGEDPFDMMEMLMKEFDLNKIYPTLKYFEYINRLNTHYASIYMERMGDYVRSKMDK